MADESFHHAIAMATHNPLLISAYEAFMTADAQAEWGSIRQRDRLRPMRQIWCRSAVPWINDLGELPGRPMD